MPTITEFTEDTINIAEKLLVNDRTGIINSIKEVPCEPNDPEIFIFGSKLARHSRYLPGSIPGRAAGAGLKKLEAKAAAIGEAVERYCASVYHRENFISGTFSEIQGDFRVPEPNSFSLFHPDQLDKLPYSEFNSDTNLSWVKGYSLVEDEPALLPACLVYLTYLPSPLSEEERIAPSISTGCATAFTYEEAILKGILEVLERDAFTVTWLNKLPCKKVDFSCSSQLSTIFSDKLDRKGLEYNIYRLPTDHDIPVFLSVLLDYRKETTHIAVGGSAHVDPSRGILNALVESAHTRKWGQGLSRKNSGEILQEGYKDIKRFEDHVLLYAEENMLQAIDFLLDNSQTVSFDKFNTSTTENTKEMLDKVLYHLGDKGMNPIAVNLTTPELGELGFKVTKVMMPKMQPLNGSYGERFLGGDRLYKIPQKLGYAKDQPSIEDFNPFPHPYP